MVRRRIIFALSAGTALLLGCGEDAQVTGSGGSTSSAGAGGAGQGGTTTGAGVGGMGSGGQGAGATGGGPPMSGDLPIGIPEPSFGWEIDTSGPATLWVDNQSPSCDDAVGSEAQPYCHLFRGQSSVSYPAGAVVHVLGGPYPIEGDLSLTFAGTEQAPVIIKGIGDGRILFDGDGARVSFDWEGSYGVLENIELFHKTRHRIVGDHLVFRNVGVTNPVEARIDFNPVVNVTGHDVLFHRGEIGNNRRDDDTDSHGIQAGSGSHHVFILENEIYNNNGDSFQGCHHCFADPPHHIYIGRNVMHEDRENGVDLKTIHDVVVSENLMWGYGSSTTSAGDAMVVGSNGFDDSINQGPRRVWVLDNTFRDSGRGIRIEGSEDVWVVGNVMEDVGTGLQIDDKSHRLVVLASNTIRNVSDGVVAWGCQPDSLQLLNNLITGTSSRQIDVDDCSAATLTLHHNLLFAAGGVAVRAAGSNYGDLASLNAASFAAGNVDGDPAFEADGVVPGASSPAIDGGTSLADVYQSFASSQGGDIARDRLGTPRPSGSAEDIGAIERP